MVALSLVGEFVGDAGIFVFSGHLQTVNDGEVAALNKEAGDARRDAGNANHEAGLARKEAADANKDAGDANERAGKLEVQAATLRKQAEDERMARIRLQERVGWRNISPADIARIGSKLRVHKVAAQIAISTISGNGEAISFSEDVGALIRAAQWPLSGIGVMMSGGVQRFGIHIGTTRDEETRTAAHALSDELGKLGFNPTVDEADEVFNKSTRPGIYVFVELRPKSVPIDETKATKP